jgi:lipooligosaccharide transport system ATP-binding protein
MSNHDPLHAKDVRKSFGKFEAVCGVSFAIQRGECYGLLGPNGAGKSTLINMIYGAARRTSGELQVFGLDPTTHSREIKRRVGVVTQDNALDESLTVRENMEIYGSFVGLKPHVRGPRVRELLRYMSLEHKENDSIRSLSGGMKRRLVFVRALLNSPELIILDEPTTGLDPAVRHLLWGKVRELKAEGKTILLTTHYIHEAEMLCDRLVIMNKGQVIAEGTPSTLRDEHAPGYVAVFDQFAELSVLETQAKARGLQTSHDSSGLYVRAAQLQELLHFQEQHSARAIQLRPANLEDVFLKLTGQELQTNA